MFVWDKYTAGEITDNIRYWVDLWEDLIDHFTERLYGLALENPRLLLKDIIDEIEFNNFRNVENKKYFQKMTDEVLKQDIAIQIILKSEWSLLRREFGLQRWSYLRQLCKGLLTKFEDGAYFEETLSILKNILLSNSNDKRLIRQLSQNLIVEFLHKEYSLKTVKEIALNIFDKYDIREDGHLITRFPYLSDWNSFVKDETFDEKEFNKSVSSEIDHITIPARIDKLRYYFFKRSSDIFFIFEVEGIKGDTDLNIGDVNFYSTNVKRYLQSDSLRDDENFNKKDSDKKYINVAVRIPMVDSGGARNRATERINRALDLLRAYYSPNVPFEILPSHLLVDNKGKEMGMSLGRKKSASGSRWWDSLNLQEIEIDKAFFETTSAFLFKATENQNETERKLTRSLRWFRKGEETDNTEDKLVNYWVVLENILRFKEPVLSANENIYELAREIVPANQGLRFIYDMGWQLFFYIETLINSYQGNRRCLDLPREIIDKCNLDPQRPATIYLQPFIDNLGELITFIDRAIIKEKLEGAIKFYGDVAHAKETIERFSDEIREDILLIYRYRNKIVHNAHHDTTILPYYVEKIRRYAGDLLRTVLTQHSSNSSATVEEIILEQYGKMNNIMEKLAKGIRIDFFTMKMP